MELSYQAKIIKTLTDAVFKISSPDTTNKGALLSHAFLWDTIQSYAKKKSDEAWSNLEKAEVYDLADAGDAAGTVCLAKSSHFAMNLTTSQPVKRFKPEALADILKKKHKIQTPVALKYCEDAKIPTKPTRSFNIIEIVPNNS